MKTNEKPIKGYLGVFFQGVKPTEKVRNKKARTLIKNQLALSINKKYPLISYHIDFIDMNRG